MKKLILILVLLTAVMLGLNAAPVYGTVTSKTIGGFAVYSGTTTYATAADTTGASMPIYSPVFTAGNVISNKSIMVVGTVTKDIKSAASAVLPRLYACLQVSVDGVNFSTVATYKVYSSSTCVAGTVITVPISLATIAAPYYRISWKGMLSTGTEETASLWGGITTSIYVSPNP